MAIPTELLDKLGDRLKPFLAQLVQEEVQQLAPSGTAPRKPARKKGRPRIPRAWVGEQEFKLDSDPMVREMEIKQLKSLAKRDQKTFKTDA